MFPVKAPVPKGCPAVSVVVAMVVAIVALVPYAKPLTVALDPPVAVMFPLRVTVVAVSEDSA